MEFAQTNRAQHSRVVGGQPHRLVLGFMLATGFLSMWLSNTATALMMMPMGMSRFAVRRAQCRACGTGSNDRQAGRELSLTLLLGIAYSASIGGFATLIGTPPNGVLVTQLRNFSLKRRI